MAHGGQWPRGGAATFRAKLFVSVRAAICPRGLKAFPRLLCSSVLGSDFNFKVLLLVFRVHLSLNTEARGLKPIIEA